MSRFTIRVELAQASRQDYVGLYEKLAQHGITDTVKTTSGCVRLPPAEYNFDGPATKEQILETVKAAAGQVVRKYAVLVTESNGRTWHGLEAA